MDLIYGLPFQNRDSFSETLHRVIDLSPDRLSLFNYTHLPDKFTSQRMIRQADLPSPREKLAIFHRATELLQDAGYLYLGMDHFAKPGDSLGKALEDRSLQRNFQGYSTHGDCDLLSFGVSSKGLQVNNSGRLLVRRICMVFDRYLQQSSTEIRYSKII
jgi:oxygen-independent coproporphyrinogen-3 oxidase